MKKLFSILLLTLCVTISAQGYNPYTTAPEDRPWKYKEAAITLATNLAAITLDAMGDAYLDRSKVEPDNRYAERGHMLSAASVGVLLVRPFLSDMDRSDWGWYVSSHILLRMGSFDHFYNMARGLPFNYIGSTSYWDKFWSNSPPSWKLMYQSLYFTVGFVIPIKEL